MTNHIIRDKASVAPFLGNLRSLGVDFRSHPLPCGVMVRIAGDEREALAAIELAKVK